MPLQKIQLRPGINRESTTYSNEGGYFSGDKIRFRSGFPEKIGGWTRLSGDIFLGTCRALLNWATLTGENYVGVGTNIKYYIERGGQYNDITPVYGTTAYTVTPPFSTAYSTLNGNISASATTIALTAGASFPQSGTVKIGTELIYYASIVNAASTLNVSGGITAISTSITVASSYGFPATGTVTIDSEEIGYTSLVGNVLSTLTRGFGGTTAAAHNDSSVTTVTSSVDILSSVVRGFEGTTAASHTTGAAVGSNIIKVIDTNNYGTNNGYVTFSGAVAIGGITAPVLNAEFQMTKYDNAYFYITCATFATSQVTAGGGLLVVAAFQVPAGLDIYTIGSGWGSGVWSRGTWGSATDATSPGVGQQLRLWTHDNYGEDLLFAPRGGAVYYWTSGSLGTRGELLSAKVGGVPGTFVPHTTNQVIMSGDSRFVVCLGANSYDELDANTVFDPMLVRWSDQENPYDWQQTITNQASEYRLASGSYIVCGQVTRQEMLIWTTNALYSMQYLGPPYVFGLNMMSDESSIMSPNAAFTINNVTYWMGTDKFYSYSGRVETLPCTLKQYIFTDINKDQGYQVFCGGNEGFNEIWWYYCSSGSVVIDRYVIYNHLERLWYYGTMGRTAWLDSSLRPFPMATNYDNRIIYHENGADNVEGSSPEAITSYIESSDFDIQDGHNFGFVWRMLPDVSFVGSSVIEGAPPQVTLSLEQRRNSGSEYGPSNAPLIISTVTTTGTGSSRTATAASSMFANVDVDSTVTKPLIYSLQTQVGTYNITAKISDTVVTITTPLGYVNEVSVIGMLWAAPTVTRTSDYTIEEYTGQIYTRLRGRQMLMRIESSRLGVRWQLGAVRIDIRPDGRR